MRTTDVLRLILILAKIIGECLAVHAGGFSAKDQCDTKYVPYVI